MVSKLSIRKPKSRYIAYTKRISTNIRKSYRANLISFVWGMLFSFIGSLIVWIFAYVGFINLGLPNRFDFEEVNKSIERVVQKGFEYSSQTLPIRNSTNNSIVVHSHEPLSRLSDFTIKDLKSDSILIMDKAESDYKKSYEYQPITYGANALHISRLQVADLDTDGRKEIIAGWSYLGANYSNPIVTIFSAGSDNDINVFGVMPKDSSTQETIKASNGGIVHSSSVYGFMSKDGSLVTFRRLDGACNACGGEHIYRTIQYLYDGSRFYEGGPDSQERLHGWKELERFASNRGYEFK